MPPKVDPAIMLLDATYIGTENPSGNLPDQGLRHVLRRVASGGHPPMEVLRALMEEGYTSETAFATALGDSRGRAEQLLLGMNQVTANVVIRGVDSQTRTAL